MTGLAKHVTGSFNFVVLLLWFGVGRDHQLFLHILYLLLCRVITGCLPLMEKVSTALVKASQTSRSSNLPYLTIGTIQSDQYFTLFFAHVFELKSLNTL